MAKARAVPAWLAARRAALPSAPPPVIGRLPAHQPFVYARRLADGREQLVHARLDTASLSGKSKTGPLAEDVATLLETSGTGGPVEERIMWAIVVPGNRSAIALVEQLGPDFIDLNIRVIPLVGGGPSLFINEHGFSVSQANCSSALFEAFLDTEEQAMRVEGATDAEVAAFRASAQWQVDPDAVRWAPAVALLPGGRLAVQFQLDVVGNSPVAEGWFGEERFTGTWSGLNGTGPLVHEGWSSQSAGSTGPDSGPPVAGVAGTLALLPGSASGAARTLAVGTPPRAIGFPAKGLPGAARLRRKAILAHGHLRA